MRFLFVFSTVVAVIFSTLTHAHAQRQHTEAAPKQDFPQQISFSYEGKEYTLKKTGASELKHVRGERTRSMFTLVHYMQDPPAGKGTSIIESVIKSTAAKQLILHLNKGFGPGKFNTRLEMIINQAISQADLQKVQQSYKTMLGHLYDAVDEEDEYAFRWLPDGKLIIAASGRPDKVINDPAFALVFWKVWLGELSPVSRTELVSSLSSR